MDTATDIGVTILTEGEVVFSSVSRVLNDKNAKVWEFDGRTKYLNTDDIITMTGVDQDGGHTIDAMFFAGEQALYTDEDKKGEPTVVRIALGNEKGWDMAVTTGRYTTRIIAYRLDYGI